MNVASSTFRSPPRLRVRSIGRRPRIIVSVVTITLCWSCAGGATDLPEDTPGREEFIGAYLDLRTAALSLESIELTDAVRDSILAVNDVTEQDLLDFVETHGEDIAFMRDLWTEIETLLTERLEHQAEEEEQEEENEGSDGTEEIDGGNAGV